MSNALKQGLRTIEYLAEGPRSAADVARYLGVDRSTGWRILQALIESNWVRQESGPSPFVLNVAHLYALAGNGHEHQALPVLVTPALTRIRDQLGESAVLGVPSRTVMVYLVHVPSQHAVTVREGVGSTRPMHASALGKAYLSALGDAELEEALRAVDFQGATERAAKSVDELKLAVWQTRERGYAVDLEESFSGVVCVAVPVLVGQDRLLIGSIGISGPRERLMMLGIERAAQVIKQEVAHLEEKFSRAGGSADAGVAAQAS
ncbi:MAG TPA: IclR family transcriptional regulator [Chloroflexota bacterium]|nr:IclR family transcriptional regulator [Chloroflexota bacterium]